jgi:hypothetical protein
MSPVPTKSAQHARRICSGRSRTSTCSCSMPSRRAHLGQLPHRCGRPGENRRHALMTHWSPPAPLLMACRYTAAIRQTLTRSHTWSCEPSPTPSTASHNPVPKGVGAQYNTQRSTIAEQTCPFIRCLESCQAEAALVNARRGDLAARLLAIGHKTASRMSPEAKRLDHAALLYDEHGLPPRSWTRRQSSRYSPRRTTRRSRPGPSPAPTCVAGH